MRSLLFVLFLIFLAGMVSASQTITGLSTNTPVPLEAELVITGTYTDTDSNVSIFCKFEAIDLNTNIIIDRFSDELTFADGTFYSQKILREPRFFRDSEYQIKVSCENATATTNFFISQRRSIENAFFGEIFFLRDNGSFLAVVFFFGIIVVLIAGGAYLYIKHVWNKGTLF